MGNWFCVIYVLSHWSPSLFYIQVDSDQDIIVCTIFLDCPDEDQEINNRNVD